MINWYEVKSQAAQYLSELIQINTSNPPGYEMQAVKWLQKKAEEHGLFTTIQETANQRGNIIISLKKHFQKPIILLSHLDVVPAVAEDWEVPPFSGEIIEDVLWGRGTIDTKQLTITHLLVLILIKKNQLQLNQDLIMIATSDEENGSTYGLLPLLEQYGSLFENSIVFNEGGGFPIHIRERSYYLCEMGQKGRAIIHVKAKQKNITNPYMPNNSSLKTITKAISRFQTIKLTETISPITQYLFQQIVYDLGLSYHPTPNDIFYENIPPQLRSLFHAMAKTTFSITKWAGGRRHPTLNGDAEFFVDCRTLPHVTHIILDEYLEIILQDLAVQYEIVEFSQGYETSIREEDLILFQKILNKELPCAKVVPFLSIGGSDSRHLRRFHSQVYGYCPVLPDMSFDHVIKMVHGKNERIPLDSLLFGIQNMFEIVTTIEGSAKP